jgi:hypothetical protein
VAGHAAGDRMNGVFHLDAFFLQVVGHFAQRMLRLRHRHAVAGTMITLEAFFMMKAASSAEPSFAGFCSPPAPPGAAVSPPKPPRMTEMKERFIGWHMI